ncbi:DUF1697 domain-containing protein [Aurantiacibacter sp. MUD11]|uniref:DUF1697 domain-containing protein n=1 Tax=Aurantiacibacter sp. MUD11 TaxID=3003265 RepID=UPI0022AADD30|nr:DUF1697 domain-containing protein [Aurantiacibacter sp. MUD11]WAT19062.1 DUF1697 domain-containing protein [Aurantiacibacter sp. MUD11]
MTAWIALLRAVNVGGTGKIEMARLRAAAEGAGLGGVRSYIASGNLVFSGPDDVEQVRALLTKAIAQEFGASPEIILRTGAQMAAVAARNPFPAAPGNKVIVIFTGGEVSTAGLRHQADEEVRAGEDELFVHYPSGQGQSKLVVPAAKEGTGRNMNTVAKLAAMAAEIA